MRFRRLLSWGSPLLSLLLFAAPVFAQEPQNEFVPLRDVPRSEQIPAAPFVFIAYSIVWLAVLFYVWTLWRRQGRVEKDLQDLRLKIGERPRAK